MQKPQDGPDSTKSRFGSVIRIGRIFSAVLATIGTIAAIVIPFYINDWTEKTSAITIRIESMRRLIAVDSRNVESLRVTIGDTAIRDPWIVSATVGNTGRLPIEAADIRSTLSLPFEGARLLEASISDRRPDIMSVSPTIHDGSVEISFDLMNPTDSFVVYFLFEGRPDFKAPRFRMRGFYEVHMVPLQDISTSATLEQIARNVTYPSAPEILRGTILVMAIILNFFLLIIGAVCVVACVIAMLTVIFGPKFSLNPKKSILAPETHMADILRKDVAALRSATTLSVFSNTPMAAYRPSKDAAIIFNLLDSSIDAIWVMTPEQLASLIEERIGDARLSLIGTDARAAASLLKDDLRRQIPICIAQAMVAALPTGATPTPASIAEEARINEHDALDDIFKKIRDVSLVYFDNYMKNIVDSKIKSQRKEAFFALVVMLPVGFMMISSALIVIRSSMNYWML